MTDPRPAKLLLHAGRGLASAVVLATTALGQTPAEPVAPVEPPAPTVPQTAPEASPKAPPVGETRTLPIVTRDPAALVGALRTLLPDAVIAVTDGQPESLTVTAASTADHDRIASLVNALDRIGIAGEVDVFAPKRMSLADARNTLLGLLGADGAIAGLALGEDPRGLRIVLRGERARLDLALQALAAIDADPSKPATEPSGARGEFAVARIPHRSPDAAAAVARALLPERVRREVRVIATPDARALVLAGDAGDLALWRAVLEATDHQAAGSRAARLVRLSTSDAPRTLADLRDRLAAARDRDAASAALVLELDAATRELAIVGSTAAVADALDLVRRIEGGRGFERETALIEAEGLTADFARLLQAQAPKTMPQRGSEPALVEPFDALGAVLVGGEPGTIDFAMKLRSAIDPRRNLAAREGDAREDARGDARGDARADPLADASADAERASLESRGLRQPYRTARIVPVGALGAASMADQLSQLLGAAVPVDTSRVVPLAEVRPLPSINALYISGEPAQLALFERVLTGWESGAVPVATPLRLLDIRCGDARAVEQGLRERFDARNAADRAARPVLVVGGEKGGALSVAMHPEMLAEVARAIDALDARADGSSAQPREVFSSTLAQSDPVVVARALNGLFPVAPMPRDANGHALPHLREPRELFASADVATRMVWVEAARERPVALDALVGLLDALALPAGSEVRLFRLDRGDVTRVVQSLRDLAARGDLSKAAAEGAAPPAPQPAIVIDADAMSRTLVVVGSKTVFDTTEEVLRQLGVLPSATGVRVVDAGGLDPTVLSARALKLAALEPADGEAPLVATTPDAARGVVTAVGDEAALERFVDACRRLVPRRGDATTVAALPLRNSDAATVAAALDGIEVGGLGTLAVDRGVTRGVVVSGSRRATIAAELLVRTLDEPQDPAKRWVVSIPCRDATLPAEAISVWLESRDLPQRQALSAKVRATPDGDRLVVAAHPTPLGAISSIVRDLGIATDRDAGSTVVQVVPLRNARAERLAALLSTRAAGGRPSDGVAKAVRAEPARNALVIASARDLAALGTIDVLVDALDQTDADGSQSHWISGGGVAANDAIRVLPVRNTAVERAAQLVREVLGGDRITDERAAAPQALVSVGEDAQGRRLLVSGPSAMCDLAEAIVARIDSAETATAPLRAAAPWIGCAEFALEHVDAEVAAGVVESVLSDRTRWPAELNDAVRDRMPVVAPRAVADRASGRIYVSAPPQLMSLATTAIERIDVDRAPTERWEMRIYPMSRAQVGPSAVAVRQAVEARRPAGGQPPRLLLDVEEEAEVLVATGEPSWLDVVDSAVRSIEVRGPRDAARVRIVSLSHAEATQVAALPGALLAGEQVKPNGPDADAALPLRALADAKANAVVLLATPGALDLAEEILVELDAAPDAPVQRSLRLYELEAGEAAVVAKSIVDLFETDDGADPLPTVRVQASRNSLLVRATDKQRATIEGLVARADAKAPSRARLVRAIGLPGSARPAAEVIELAERLRGRDARVAFGVDVRGNAVVAFGALDAIEHAAWVLTQVAGIPRGGDDAVQRFEVPVSAEPRAIAAQAVAMFGQLGVDWRCGTGTTQPRLVMTDRCDQRAIASIASADNVRVVEALISILVQGQNAGPVALRQVRLSATDAARVGGLLRDGGPRSDGTLRVVDNDRMQTIVLVGSPREVEAAAMRAARLDRGPEQSRSEEVRLLPLRGLRATDAVELIGSVIPIGGPQPWIVAEPITNAVVLRGNAPDLKPLGELLARLDDPMAKGLPPFEVIQVEHRTPSEVRTAIDAALASAVDGSDPARRERMRLVADDALGVLFVRADAALIAELRAAIAAADVPPPPPAPVEPEPATEPAPAPAPESPATPDAPAP